MHISWLYRIYTINIASKDRHNLYIYRLCAKYMTSKDRHIRCIIMVYIFIIYGKSTETYRSANMHVHQWTCLNVSCTYFCQIRPDVSERIWKKICANTYKIRTYIRTGYVRARIWYWHVSIAYWHVSIPYVPQVLDRICMYLHVFW